MMIRILNVCGTLNRGGAENVIMNVYRNIDREQVQFDFVIPSEREWEFSSEVRSLGGIIYGCPKLSWSTYFQYKKWWKDFFAHHKEYKVLHSHIRSTASIYIPMAKRNGLKTIIHSHSTSNGSGYKSIIKRILQLPLRYQADYLFACSTEAGKWLFGEESTNRNNYFFFPNCIDLEKYGYSEKKRKIIRNQYSIAHDCFVIGHVGSFRDAKNHELIIRVFKDLKRKCEKAILLLVGDGEKKESIKQLCEELGINDSVIFTGLQEDTSPYYSAMDCFFFPSLWEGLPVSVVESQANGLNSIISDVITKDVQVTDLVHPISLIVSRNIWVDELLKYEPLHREEITKENLRKLLKFDSEETALWLQHFYQKIIREKE